MLEDVTKLQDRIITLENFVSENQSETRTELARMMVAERLMAHRMDGIMQDIRNNAMALDDSLEGLARNIEGVSRTVEWPKYYMAKFTHSIHHGSRIISNLNMLIEGLQWLDQSVLTPIIVPTSVLEEAITFIQDHLEHNATTPVMLIPYSVLELHNFMSFYLARLNDQLLVALSIQLTSYSEAVVIYEFTVLPIAIPNSDLGSILDPEHRFVAIHDSTGHYVELKMEQVRGVQSSPQYLIQDVLVRTDADNSCILAIYQNMPKLFCSISATQYWSP